MMRAERPAFQKLRVTPGIMNTPERITKDLAQARKLATWFENEYYSHGNGSEEEKRGSAAIDERVASMPEFTMDATMAETSRDVDASIVNDDDPEKPATESGEQSNPSKSHQNLKVQKKTLDFFLYYLRTVFNSCYYCACVCDFQEELLRRCAKHVRRPAPNLADEGGAQGGARRGASLHGVNPRANESSWARTLDDRLNLILEPSEVDPRDFGGEKIDELSGYVVISYPYPLPFFTQITHEHSLFGLNVRTVVKFIGYASLKSRTKGQVNFDARIVVNCLKP